MEASEATVVIGSGWAALGAVGFLASIGTPVYWITGSNTKLAPPLASLEWGPGIRVWGELFNRLAIPCGELNTVNNIREYRNKSFRETLWSKAPTLEQKKQVMEEVLWEPELRLVGAVEAQWEIPLSELEDSVRTLLYSETYVHVKKIEGIPVTGFKREEGHIKAVSLASGEQIPCLQVIYADRWSLLHAMEGLPKPLTFVAKRDPVGVLQATFVHRPAMTANIQESFFSSLHRESNDSVERHVWGHFSKDGSKSIWSLCLTQEEVEDNHEITKKLRKMKSTLDKIFSNHGILPEGCATFGATLLEEQVRFVEEMIFARGTPLKSPILLSDAQGILFLTDGYGPSWALSQVGSAFGIIGEESNPEAEGVDAGNPKISQ